MGRDRRDLEHAAPGGTQATAVMATHGGADGGRSHVGGGLTSPGGRPMVAELVVEEHEVETESR